MKKKILFSFLITVLTGIAAWSQQEPYSLVNPFIGTGGHGHTFPGASMPFGMMQLSPDTREANWDGSSGYHYSDTLIFGFSHTHLSGTGIPDYCDVLFMPFAGKVQWDPAMYRSGFSHKNEKAMPGYYEVLLDKQKIRAQLAASYRSGLHQYTFPKGTFSGAVLIDLKHRDEVLDSWIEKVSDYEVRGMRRSKSWAQDQVLYFHAIFEKPMAKMVVYDGTTGKETELQSGKRISGKHLKAYVEGRLGHEGQFRTRVGISAVSAENAKQNLVKEISDWNINKVKDEARKAWNRELGKITIKGGTKDQQTVFYTALYHTMLAPNIFQDVNGSYRGTDGRIHTADGFTNHTVFSLWDTYRAYHPLMSIINRKRTTDWIRTFLQQYRQGGMLPVWELAGNETFCMIGYHSVPVILDAYRNGIRNFDAALALEAMRSYAESNRFGLDQYRRQGYISNEHEHESVSKTLEYAYDDWCIAQFAKMTGHDSVYRQYIERAQNYKNLFDPSTGHMRGKVQAMWYHPFDPAEINNFYTEGNSWQYSFAVPHDIGGLMELHGGQEKFAAKLQSLFTVSSETKGREQPDVTGLIGQYAQGNEPSHHMVYLFNHAGQPWRTQELIDRICREFYLNSPDGLIGNEDCGQMSAWYIFSAMGFYPVCPGDGKYSIGKPMFDEITLQLENGKKFTVKANTAAGKYVQSVQYNGMPAGWELQHADIMKGGVLNFTMGAAAQKNVAGTYAATIKEAFLPVNYFDIPAHKFRDSLEVRISNVDPGAVIYYAVADTNGNGSRPQKYEGPFTIHDHVRVTTYSVKGNIESKKVQQRFYMIPSDRSITVSSQVHPMYTGGGQDALVDGIMGTVNWRAGEWQSYFNQDFEAVIDLQQERKISFIGVHVLQDISPWIMFPKELIYYTSVDGKEFREAGRVRNMIAADDKKLQTQVLGTDVNLSARYIRIRALNGGRLPAWHESAGNPTHLFIDEVLIR